MKSEPGHFETFETVDVTSTRLRLRDDLRVTTQAYGDQLCYLIEDPYSGKFHRVGLPEYTILSLLDGKSTIGDVVGHAAAIVGGDALGEQQAFGFCKWMIDEGLAFNEATSSSERLAEREAKLREEKRKQWNPLFQRLPLGNPDNIVSKVTSVLGILFSRVGLVAAMLLLTIATLQVAMNWNLIAAQTNSIIDPNNWIWFLASAVVLRVFHELGHAVACRRFGGSVNEAGAIFILFAPLPYVDATSSWRFASKWRRIAVALGGVYFELIIAAVAAIVWTQSDSPFLQQHARNVVFSAVVVTLLFNLNPLMRFDGYFVLSDLIGLPNLASHGQRVVREMMAGIFGFTQRSTDRSWGRWSFLLCYGIGAWCWKVLISVSIFTAAESLFFGFGIVLCAMTLVFWWGVPMVRFAYESTKRGPNLSTFRPLRAVVACGTIGLFAFAANSWIPWYSSLKLAGVVEFENVTEIRPAASGFLKEVFIEEGDQVQTGQTIARMENIELSLEIEAMELAIAQSEQRTRMFRAKKQNASSEVQRSKTNSLRIQLEQLRQQRTELSIVAECNGRVLSWSEDLTEGRYIQSGTLVCKIASGEPTMFRTLVPQDDIDAIRELTRTANPNRATIEGMKSLVPVRIHEMDPVATTNILLPELGANHGGNLSVTRNPNPSEPNDSEWTLSESHLLVTFAMTPRNDATLMAGQTGVVKLAAYKGPFSDVLVRKISNWWHQRRQQAWSRWRFQS